MFFWKPHKTSLLKLMLLEYLVLWWLYCCLLITFIHFHTGYSSCYTNGTYTWYLGYCFMQKVERLVALGNCTLITDVWQYCSLGRSLLCLFITDFNSIWMQVADGDLPIVASHGWVFINIWITLTYISSDVF